MTRYYSLAALIILLASPQTGQSSLQKLPHEEKRIALVIGNGNYVSSLLANPENDARAMSDELQKLGFRVTEYRNLDQVQMKKAIDDFGLHLKGMISDCSIMQVMDQAKGYNYLIPVDAQLKTEEQVEYDCVRADRVLALMETSGTKVNIIILDACRNNPFERSWTRSANGKRTRIYECSQRHPDSICNRTGEYCFGWFW